MLESPEDLAEIVDGPLGSVCALDPEGSPPGAVFRVLYDSPFLGQDVGTGTFANTAPVAHARTGDVASVVPEQTILRIEGVDYVAKHIEPEPGSAAWQTVVLRKAHAA